MKKKIFRVISLIVIIMLFLGVPMIANAEEGLPEINDIKIEFFDADGIVNDILFIYPDNETILNYSFPINTQEMQVTVIANSDEYTLDIKVNKGEYGPNPYYDISEFELYYIDIILFDETNDQMVEFDIQLERKAAPRSSSIHSIAWRIQNGDDDYYYPDEITFIDDITTIEVPFSLKIILLDYFVPDCNFSSIRVLCENGDVLYANENSIEIKAQDGDSRFILESKVDGATSYYELIFTKAKTVSDNNLINSIEFECCGEDDIILETDIIELEKDKFDYSITIPEDTKTIYLFGNTNSITSKTEYLLDGIKLEETFFEISDDIIIDIVSTAENGDSQIYKLNIIKSENISQTSNEVAVTVESEKSTGNINIAAKPGLAYWIWIVIGAGLVSLITVIVIILNKRKK